MKRIFMFSIVLMIFALIAGCNFAHNDPDMQQAKQQDKLTREMNAQLGLPNITNFQQKKILKMIEEECDKENLICYAYLQSEYTGKLIYIGKCIGYGVPFSAEYTNPEKVIMNSDGSYMGQSPVTIPQADPNGLFMPSSSNATWLLLIDPNTNKPRVVYLEPNIVVSPFQLQLGLQN